MGNVLVTVVGSMVGIYYKLLEKAYKFTSKKKDYYHSEILLKDEENQADLLSNEDIKNIIKSQKNGELKNEYQLIKFNDDNDYFNTNKDKNNNNEIEDIQKEINLLNIDINEKNENNNDDNNSNIDELKVQMLDNHNNNYTSDHLNK